MNKCILDNVYFGFRLLLKNVVVLCFQIFVKDSDKLVSDALAVDWLNRNLYWLDSNVAQIKVVDALLF